MRFLRDVVHLWPLPADLRPLGPIANGVYTSGAYDVDLSTLPGGERYAEIGIKVPPGLLDEARRKLDALSR